MEKSRSGQTNSVIKTRSGHGNPGIGSASALQLSQTTVLPMFRCLALVSVFYRHATLVSAIRMLLDVREWRLMLLNLVT